MTADASGRKRHPVRVLALCAALAFLGFIPGMGIPGALVMVVGDVILRPFRGLTGYAAPSGDAAWPAALIVTLLWPWSIAAGYMVAEYGISSASSRTRLAILALVCAAWGILLTLIVSGMAA